MIDNVLQISREQIEKAIAILNPCMNDYIYVYDLIDEYSLRSLSILEKEHNRQCYMDTRLYYDDFMPTFFD